MEGISDFEKAQEFAKSGRKKDAREILRQLLSVNNQDEKSWMLFSEISEKKEHEIQCLRNVIRINPNNDEAKQRLFFLTQPAHSPTELNFGATELDSGTRVCPFCKEKVNEGATVCSHCGRNISTTQQKINRFIRNYIRNLLLVVLLLIVLFIISPEITKLMFEFYWYFLGPLALLVLAVFALPRR